MFEDWERYVCEFWGLTAEAWQREFLRAIGRPPIVALTATSTPEATRDIVAQLRLKDPHVVRHRVERPNLAFSVHRCVNDEIKLDRLRELPAGEPGTAIVYCATVAAASPRERRSVR